MSHLKYFKITKTWAVKAESETEAIKLIAAEPVKYLDAETVTRTEYKKPQPKTGWGTLQSSNAKVWIVPSTRFPVPVWRSRWEQEPQWEAA